MVNIQKASYIRSYANQFHFMAGSWRKVKSDYYVIKENFNEYLAKL